MHPVPGFLRGLWHNLCQSKTYSVRFFTLAVQTEHSML